MAGDTIITLVGNLVEDPELRFTPSGAAVANFRVASTPRSFDRQSGEWRDGDTLFITCNAWRQSAENVAESLQRGMRVIVQGRFKARSFETREGEKRTVFEIDVDEVGPSLRSATAKVTKTTRSQGGFSGGNDPWANAGQPMGDQGQAAPSGGSGSGSGGGGGGAGQDWGSGPTQGSYDEPPF